MNANQDRHNSDGDGGEFEEEIDDFIECGHGFLFACRACDALVAISILRSLESFLNLAKPPILPNASAAFLINSFSFMALIYSPIALAARTILTSLPSCVN